MSAMIKGRSAPSYRGSQSDDDFQRHNANRHHREGSGQDRLGQQATAMYTDQRDCWRSDGHYYYLKSLGDYGPLDGQWVNAKKLEQAGRTSAGARLWRSK